MRRVCDGRTGVGPAGRARAIAAHRQGNRRPHGRLCMTPRVQLRGYPLILAAITIAAATRAFASPLFTGPYIRHAAGDQASDVVVADLNHDGRPDLVVAHENSESISVLLGSPGGDLAPMREYAVGTGSAVAIGDVDGDGNLDLVTGSDSIGGVDILLGNGDGTFKTPYALQGVHSPFVAVADLNGDHNLDIVTAGASLSLFTISVWLGTGNGQFPTRTEVE